MAQFDFEIDQYPVFPTVFINELPPRDVQNLTILGDSIIEASRNVRDALDEDIGSFRRRFKTFHSQKQTIPVIIQHITQQLGSEKIKQYLYYSAYTLAIKIYRWRIESKKDINSDTVKEFLDKCDCYRYYIAARNLFDTLDENEQEGYKDIVERLTHPDKLAQMKLEADQTEDEDLREFKSDLAEFFDILGDQDEITYTLMAGYEI